MVSSYTYTSEVYDGVRVERVTHHVAYTIDADYWWGATILCTRQNIEGGRWPIKSWPVDDPRFSVEEPVTCLSCLVMVGPMSS